MVDGTPARVGRGTDDDDPTGVGPQQVVDLLGVRRVVEISARERQVGETGEEEHVVAELAQARSGELFDQRCGGLPLAQLGVDQRHRARRRGVWRGRAQCGAQEGVELLVARRTATTPETSASRTRLRRAGFQLGGPAIGHRRRAPRRHAKRPCMFARKRPELGGVGEEERLVEALGQLGMGVELAVGGGHVAVLEEIGEPPATRRDGELELVRLERQVPALGGVSEALLEVVRAPLGVAAAVDRHRQRRRVAQPPSHRHCFLAELEATTVEVGPVEGDGQARQQASPHLRVAGREGAERLLEEGDKRLVATAAEVIAGDPGVADRRTGQPIAEPGVAGQLSRLEVGRPSRHPCRRCACLPRQGRAGGRSAAPDRSTRSDTSMSSARRKCAAASS